LTRSIDKKAKAAAVVTVRDGAAMTKRGRFEVARWLRHQANLLEVEGPRYAARFTGRYLYRSTP
jgi:hypothetical protein